MPTQDIKRARIIAVILGTAVTVTLCSLIYAQFQVKQAEHLERKIDSLKIELESIRSLHKSID